MRSARSAASPSHQASSTLPRRCARGGMVLTANAQASRAGQEETCTGGAELVFYPMNTKL